MWMYDKDFLEKNNLKVSKTLFKNIDFIEIDNRNTNINNVFQIIVK
jgi:hypothetical protein